MANSQTNRPWHGGNLSQAQQRFGNAPLLDFSANINPLGLPPAVARELPRCLSGIVHYPDPYAHDLQEALAEFLNIEPHNLLLGNGSIELIYLLPRLGQVSKVAVPAPGFSEYEYAAGLVGAECLRMLLRPPDYAWDLDQIMAIIPQVDMLFLCNPNNPTGTLLGSTDLDKIVNALPPQGTLLVMDEAFMDFVTDKEELSLVQQATEDPRLVVLGSLTKFFALPGLRLGYLVGTPPLIKRLGSQLPPWNLNALAQTAGLLALQDREFIQSSRQYMEQARREFYRALQSLPGLHPLYPHANFIFCRLGPELPNAPQLVQALGQRGLLIRDCSNYPGLDDRCIRLAVRRQEENMVLVAALKEILPHGA